MTTMEERWQALDAADKGPSNGLTPHLVVSDGQAAMDFYRRAFAAEEVYTMRADDGRRILNASLRINGAWAMLNDDFPEMRGGDGPLPAPEGVTLHLHVDDADAWFDRAVAAGATPTMPLADMFWGDRYGQVRDPFGHSWSIGATLKGNAA